MHDEARSTGTAHLLGAYWLDSAYWHAQQPCCCFAPPPQRRLPGTHIALTVAACALILTAFALTASA
ncbi:hypothetical protein ACIRU3_44955 [Streptomyces sp. NPDC101151]|uniref:hypothetical protein n=1 Tax=Streptomyces sp. NPDC101151 TaxID=3366115 RepID=UPI0038015595